MSLGSFPWERLTPFPLHASPSLLLPIDQLEIRDSLRIWGILNPWFLSTPSSILISLLLGLKQLAAFPISPFTQNGIPHQPSQPTWEFPKSHLLHHRSSSLPGSEEVSVSVFHMIWYRGGNVVLGRKWVAEMDIKKCPSSEKQKSI